MFGLEGLEFLFVGVLIILIILAIIFFTRRSRMDSSYLKKYLFSFEGRVTRIEYWMYIGLLIIGMIIASFILIAVPEEQQMTITVVIMFGLVYFWPLIAIQAKRWHDRDKSGWWILINLIPIIGFWALIENGFLKGTTGTNRFGEDPYKRSTSNKESASYKTDGDKEEIMTRMEAPFEDHRNLLKTN